MTKLVVLSHKNNFEKIAEAFSQGKIVCIPTDTTYCMSCDATNIKAIHAIYHIKNRSLKKRLPVFVADLKMAQRYVSFYSTELQILKYYWPGALTIVSRILRNTNLPDILVNNGKIAIRVPDYKIIQNICNDINKPIIATSVNISSHSSLNNVEEIIKTFYNAIDYIVRDLTLCTNDNLIPSTIIEFIEKDKFKILREGRVLRRSLDSIIF